jgi:plasmid stability protein
MKAIYVEDDIHRRLKVLAARRGRALKQVVQQLLDRGLRADAPDGDTATDLLALASRGGSFDFLADEREDLYSLEEGEAIE